VNLQVAIFISRKKEKTFSRSTVSGILFLVVVADIDEACRRSFLSSGPLLKPIRSRTCSKGAA
jgi:hypothetical protein